MRFYLPSRDKIKKLFKNMEEIKRLISENKLEGSDPALGRLPHGATEIRRGLVSPRKAHYKPRQRTPSPQQLPASDRDQSGKPGTSGLRYGDQGTGFL